MGVAEADYDNDGHPAIYITGYPSGALYRNNGDGPFTDVTAQAGVANRGEWGASAAWFDYDNDGRLDLFIANYAEFSFGDPRRCEFDGKPAYCAQTPIRAARRASITTTATEPLPTSEPPAELPLYPAGRSAWSRSTTMATGARICSSPATHLRTCCYATAAIARSRT